MMKVLLLQLPVQTHDFFYSKENVPLACSYLQLTGREAGFDVEMVPAHLMSYGSDQAILQFLGDFRPDLVGMSCYQWNIERSLFLAREIKRSLPSCRIVMGGPEVTPENEFLLHHRDFDVGVVGEGEETWEILLRSFPEIPDSPGFLVPETDQGWRFTGEGTSQLSLERSSSPFLEGVLDSHLEGVLWLETVRGCTHHCAYCYYHKQFSKLRLFPVERILKEVRRAWARGFKEIVFLDPCFTSHPQLGFFLEELAAINYDRRVAFQAECNAEEIEPGIAEKMGRAGFTRIEAGLQSIKRETLKKVHRNFDARRFLRGVYLLQDHGIEVMVDLIAGLPGDTLSDMRNSLDWVLDHEAYDSLMLYPLSLMPGTDLGRQARKWKLYAMPHPPYLVTRGSGLSAQDMKDAFHYYASCMKADISPLESPSSFDSGYSPAGGLNHEVKSIPEQLEHQHTYSMTIRLTRETLREVQTCVQALRDYLMRNPFSLVSVEVPPDAFPEDLKPLWDLAKERTHPVDRDYTVTHTPHRSFFLFSRFRGLIWKWPDPRESKPYILHDGQEISFRPTCLVAGAEDGIPEWFLSHLGNRYRTLPDIRAWERPSENNWNVRTPE